MQHQARINVFAGVFSVLVKYLLRIRLWHCGGRRHRRRALEKKGMGMRYQARAQNCA